MDTIGLHTSPVLIAHINCFIYGKNMSQEFFLQRDGVKTGPFTTEQIQGFSKNGNLRSSDLVCFEDGRELPINQIPNLGIGNASKAAEPAINVNPTPQVTSTIPPSLPTQTKEWFYSKEGQQLGPYLKQELVILLSNDIDGQTLLVWKQGMENWVEARTVLPFVNQTRVDVSNQIVSRRSTQESARSRRIIIYSILGVVAVVAVGAGGVGIVATQTDFFQGNSSVWTGPDPTMVAVWDMPGAPPMDYEQTDDYTSDPDAEAPGGPEGDPYAFSR
jgi:hypothetical protein